MQVVLEQSVGELLSCMFVLSVMLDDKMSEYIVGRFVETFPYADGVFLLVSFVFLQGLVYRHFREAFELALVGRNLCVQSHFSVFKKRHQGGGLEHGSRFSRPSDSHIQIFSKLSLAVLLEVDHGFYRSCLHFHYHHTSSFYKLVVGYLSS